MKFTGSQEPNIPTETPRQKLPEAICSPGLASGISQFPLYFAEIVMVQFPGKPTMTPCYIITRRQHQTESRF